MDLLLGHFLKAGANAEDIAEIQAAFRSKTIAKGTYFVEEGKVSRHLAFVVKGLFQYFYLKDGKEITTYASGNNSFLLSLASFYKREPSKEYIRALSDAELWVMHYDDLNRLKKDNRAFRSFYIDALEGLIIAMDETRSNLIIMSAEERYDFLMKKEPELLQQIPLQHLASILAVTPRHLSRIRSNYQKQP